MSFGNRRKTIFYYVSTTYTYIMCPLHILIPRRKHTLNINHLQIQNKPFYINSLINIRRSWCEPGVFAGENWISRRLGIGIRLSIAGVESYKSLGLWDD